MSRKNFIKAIADSEEITQAKAEAILKTIEGLYVSELKAHGEHTIAGVGKLKLKQKPERPGRNPKTGEAITIAPSTSVSFVIAKPLKEALNG